MTSKRLRPRKKIRGDVVPAADNANAAARADPKARPKAPPQPGRFPVVGVGASAGGLKALQELFGNMPADTGAAFVVITHQAADHPSLLPELLAEVTPLPVERCADGTRLTPDRIYVAPPGYELALLDGVLQTMVPNRNEVPHLPINAFFRSLAADQKGRGVCVVLSGTGSDGARGLEAVKAEGGLALVQEPATAQYPGMPASAIATDRADHVLPPDDMPERLTAYAEKLRRGRSGAVEFPEISPAELRQIFILLRDRTGCDFSAYKPGTIQRRIVRRMELRRSKSYRDYIASMQQDPQEVTRLFAELLIGVTAFFRDPDAWGALAPQLDALVEHCPAERALRGWICGGASGEEAYSLAIALREAMDRVQRFPKVQLFSTDLDEGAIETARAGVYPEDIAADLAPSRLDRYFTHEEGGYRVRSEIREMLVFSRQDLIQDPPFTRLDILVCRNLLIYFEPALQKRLLPTFHYTLRPEGILFLGPSENVTPSQELFEPIDKRWKIFRRKAGPGALNAAFPAAATPRAVEQAPNAARAEGSPEPDAVAAVERLLVQRFAPPSVVASPQGRIFYIHGRTGAYLEPAQGAPRNNLLDMAREGLKMELAGCLRECAASGAEVRREAVPMKSDGGFAEANLTVSPIADPPAIRGLLLVSFQPTPPETIPPPLPADAEGQGRETAHVGNLERQLRQSRGQHHLMQKELEGSNEELKSTNEELQSTNEELQSANEELETSKEEMQSLNEELNTVNTELQAKVEQLSQANNDMQNLLNSTDIATVFLDDDLNINRFTPQATELVRLRLSDVGRPISELASELDAGAIADDCRQVLKTLVFKEKEIQTQDGRFFLMRIMPYRTDKNVIEGLVLTFVDIARVKGGEGARHRFDAVFELAPGPMVLFDANLRVLAVNPAYCRTFSVACPELTGAPADRLGDDRWDGKALYNRLARLLVEGEEVLEHRIEATASARGAPGWRLDARRLEAADQPPGRILAALSPLPADEREADA